MVSGEWLWFVESGTEHSQHERPKNERSGKWASTALTVGPNLDRPRFLEGFPILVSRQAKPVAKYDDGDAGSIDAEASLRIFENSERFERKAKKATKSRRRCRLCLLCCLLFRIRSAGHAHAVRSGDRPKPSGSVKTGRNQAEPPGSVRRPATTRRPCSHRSERPRAVPYRSGRLGGRRSCPLDLWLRREMRPRHRMRRNTLVGNELGCQSRRCGFCFCQPLLFQRNDKSTRARIPSRAPRGSVRRPARTLETGPNAGDRPQRGEPGQ